MSPIFRAQIATDALRFHCDIAGCGKSYLDIKGLNVHKKKHMNTARKQPPTASKSEESHQLLPRKSASLAAVSTSVAVSTSTSSSSSSSTQSTQYARLKDLHQNTNTFAFRESYLGTIPYFNNIRGVPYVEATKLSPTKIGELRCRELDSYYVRPDDYVTVKETKTRLGDGTEVVTYEPLSFRDEMNTTFINEKGKEKLLFWYGCLAGKVPAKRKCVAVHSMGAACRLSINFVNGEHAELSTADIGAAYIEFNGEYFHVQEEQIFKIVARNLMDGATEEEVVDGKLSNDHANNNKRDNNFVNNGGMLTAKQQNRNRISSNVAVAVKIVKTGKISPLSSLVSPLSPLNIYS